MVDYYSNFIEIFLLPGTSSCEVIDRIKANVARYGIIQILITDNGPRFSSHEFKMFTESYGINHITSSPRRQ